MVYRVHVLLVVFSSGCLASTETANGAEEKDHSEGSVVVELHGDVDHRQIEIPCANQGCSLSIRLCATFSSTFDRQALNATEIVVAHAGLRRDGWANRLPDSNPQTALSSIRHAQCTGGEFQIEPSPLGYATLEIWRSRRSSVDVEVAYTVEDSPLCGMESHGDEDLELGSLTYGSRPVYRQDMLDHAEDARYYSVLFNDHDSIGNSNLSVEVNSPPGNYQLTGTFRCGNSSHPSVTCGGADVTGYFDYGCRVDFHDSTRLEIEPNCDGSDDSGTLSFTLEPVAWGGRCEPYSVRVAVD